MFLARAGDLCGGGTIIASHFVDFAGLLPIACIGDMVTPHGPPPHHAAVIMTGAFTVIAGLRPVTCLGYMASCGHTITTGDPLHMTLP